MKRCIKPTRKQRRLLTNAIFWCSTKRLPRKKKKEFKKNVLAVLGQSFATKPETHNPKGFRYLFGEPGFYMPKNYANSLMIKTAI